MNNKDFDEVLGYYYHWLITDSSVFLEINGKEYRVKDLKIAANGTHDLCFINENGKLTMGDINKVDPKKVVYMPMHDVALFEFEESLPFPFNKPVIILEIDHNLEPVIKKIVKIFWGGKKNKFYDAYLGKEYWR